MTPHFSLQTDPLLKCPCGCGMVPRQEFLEKLETVRVVYGKPMKVNSGARCSEYNAKVSSTGPNGPHTTGRAVDIGVSGSDAHELLRVAMRHGNFTGIGVSQKGPHEKRFLHFDDLPNGAHPRSRIWSY